MSYGSFLGLLEQNQILFLFKDFIGKKPIFALILRYYLKYFGYPDIGGQLHYHYLNKFMHCRPGDFILDAGCGNGLFIIDYVRKNNIRGFGIDIVDQRIKFASSIAKALNTPISFKKMEVEQLSFPNNYFHKIFCIEVLQFVNNPAQVFKEFKRVLKRNGKLFIFSPAEQYYESFSRNPEPGLAIIRKGLSIKEIDSYSNGLEIIMTKPIAGRLYKIIAKLQSLYYRNKLKYLHFVFYPILSFLCLMDSKITKAVPKKAINLYIFKKI